MQLKIKIAKTHLCFPIYSDENLENQDVFETFHKILNIIKSCESVSTNFVKDGKIENAADYLIDAQIMKMSHELMGSTAEKIGNSEFSEDEYISALTNLFTSNDGDYDFDKLADIAVSCSKPMNFCVSLLGTFDIEAPPRPEKIRKEAQRVKKPLAPTKAPKSIKQLNKSGKGPEKVNIVFKEVQRICQERKTDSIPYFELVCDPQDFMKTVDVCFQISFLVRDGLLGLKRVDGEPIVVLHNPELNQTQQTQCDRPNDSIQAVSSLTPSLWRQKIKKFMIKTPLIVDNGDENQSEASMDVD